MSEDNQKILKQYLIATKRTKTRVASIETMAQAERAVPGGALDEGNVLNLANGTLDLVTFTLKPHHRGDLLTYCLPYAFEPTADCPRWEQFVQEVLIDEATRQHDPTLSALLQELFGYSLTTDTSQEVMTWLHGNGGNGKTIVIGILHNLLGTLATAVDFNHLGQHGNYELAKLPGKRVIFSSESERGGKVAEGWLKRIVSGETINARPIYGQPMDFVSVSKVWWAMNDKPLIRDSSDAIWRRLRLIPFNRTFSIEERDVNLKDKLKLELPGILNWALAGLQRLRRSGLFTDAAAATDALTELRRESNPVQQWMEERTKILDSPQTAATTLYEDYKVWAGENGRESLNSTNFGRELSRLPGVAKRTSTYVFYNVGLATDF